ncbi:MAG TPA: DpnD/PcfM family protein [Methanocorpusculum sp.]|nr:DpnD/PcfM family protein [Methanocorpusculum sp.]HJJ32936.1 DpnD/PcfM family protein [Methanocorpusculum sp.]HJJ44254.1 DpnD/PcfM family protein [Methanocorpusculum sp.]
MSAHTHTYTYLIEETLSRSVTISAATETEAYRILRDRYRNEDIVLDDSDHCCTEIYRRDDNGTLEKKE